MQDALIVACVTMPSHQLKIDKSKQPAPALVSLWFVSGRLLSSGDTERSPYRVIA